ncbi:tetratricopeptide repeat-containing sensor histidine kinase [Aquimarina sp. 2201CG14-23]|uniref:tetratricopeptide repeat-containing sensor histidine kinase n=1 Tax=Aquimarina mycalae TaxID=3040073 RepID=UPI0024780161|nr:sensor histidine kinase [Aquimarina sp. 2201CG14-23]MDH7444074.1 sensor histidine kinase [Aquimarina sp. 2201CG14-23]
MLNYHNNKIFFFVISALIMIGCDKQDTVPDNIELKYSLIDDHIKDSKDKNKSKDERRKSVDKAYSLYSTLSQDNKSKLKRIQEISGSYYDLGEYEISSDMDSKMLFLAISIKDSLGMAKSYGYRGLYFRDRIIDSAYKNFYEADKLYRALEKRDNYSISENAFVHGTVLIDLAKLSLKVKDYSESEHLVIRAIEKFELSDDLTYLPLCYSTLGTVAKYLERYDDAITYHEKAIENAKNTSKEILYAVISNNNIGTVYKSKKDYKKANEYYTKALSYKDFLSKRPKRYARYLDNLAYVNFLENKDNEETFKLFNKALRIRDSVNDVVGLSTNNLHLAEYFKAKGEDSLAKLYALKVKEAAPLVNSNVELLQSYQLLSEVSDSETGLAYAQNYIKLNDSLIKEERAYVNKFARIQFETEEKEEQITQISREKQYLMFAILGLSVLFLLGYVIFRQQQSNKELLFEQKQQQSNQEIYRLLLSQQLKLEEGRKLEQHRMSEELHDGVLGRLFGVRLSLDGINQRANDGFTDARNKYIDELKSIEKEIRLISHDLGTETLSPDIAYVDVVESLVSDLCTVHKVDFAFTNDENIDWETIDDQKKVNLFRIIQESLQNIFKHAQAKSVKINFDYVDDKINLTILDDGIGFKSSKVKRGIGLKNITSRVTQMDGVVDFISNQDAGTKVSVGIPI